MEKTATAYDRAASLIESIRMRLESFEAGVKAIQEALGEDFPYTDRMTFVLGEHEKKHRLTLHFTSSSDINLAAEQLQEKLGIRMHKYQGNVYWISRYKFFTIEIIYGNIYV